VGRGSQLPYLPSVCLHLDTFMYISDSNVIDNASFTPDPISQIKLLNARKSDGCSKLFYCNTFLLIWDQPISPCAACDDRKLTIVF